MAFFGLRLSKRPKVTARVKLARLLAIQSAFLGIFIAETMVVAIIGRVVFKALILIVYIGF